MLDFYASKIRMIALSRIRSIIDDGKANPDMFKKDTREYCDAMYDILDTMPEDRLQSIVSKLHQNFAEVGMDDDGYVADSLMMFALAAYQTECGEQNVYDMGWDRMVEEFFHTQAV